MDPSPFRLCSEHKAGVGSAGVLPVTGRADGAPAGSSWGLRRISDRAAVAPPESKQAGTPSAGAWARSVGSVGGQRGLWVGETPGDPLGGFGDRRPSRLAAESSGYIIPTPHTAAFVSGSSQV